MGEASEALEATTNYEILDAELHFSPYFHIYSYFHLRS